MKGLIQTGLMVALSVTFMVNSNTATAQSSSKDPVVVGVNVWVGWMPWWIVEEKNFLEKHNANAKLRFFGVQSESQNALAAGHLDAASLASGDVLSVNANSVPTSIVNLTNVSAGADMLITRGVDKVKDLKGQRIGVEIGGVSHFFLVKLLEKHGMSEEDVRLTNMSAANAGSAFIAGSIDAVVTWEPHATKALDEGGEILASSKDTPNAVVDVLTVRDDVLSKRREDMKKVLAAWFEALDFVETNPEKAFAIMAEGADVSVSQMKSMWSGVYMYKRSDVIKTMGTPNEQGPYYETINDMSEFMVNQDLIPRPVDPTEMIDASLVRELGEKGVQ